MKSEVETEHDPISGPMGSREVDGILMVDQGLPKSTAATATYEIRRWISGDPIHCSKTTFMVYYLQEIHPIA
jgi:hypothetical protein